MWKLKRYLKGYKVQAVLAPLFKLLEAVFELLVPLIVAALVDRGLAEGEPDSNYIIKMTSLLILFAVIGLFSAITAQYFSSFIAAGFGSALRKDLFSHILSLSHRELDEIGKNTLITRITQDTQQIQNGVNMFFRLVFALPLSWQEGW